MKKSKKLIKTIIQYSKPLLEADFNHLVKMQDTYRKIKSFTYHNLRGIKYINNLNFRDIRNNWMKNEVFNQWNISGRLRKLALFDAISQIESKHSNVSNEVLQAMKNNKNLSNEDKHYLAFILGKKELWSKILNNIPLSEDDYWKNKEKFSTLNIKKLNNYIKRKTRKYNTKMVAKSNRTMFFDSEMYSASKGKIELVSLIPRKRIKVELLDNQIIAKGNIKIILDKDKQRIEIHSSIEVEKIINNNEVTLGIDKGYIDLLATSSSHIYGKQASGNIKKKVEYVDDKYKKRNKLFKIAEKYKENGNLKKYFNIINNNLGNKKIKKNKNKFNEKIKSNINNSINELIRLEKPKVIIMEELVFVKKSKKKRTKKINRELSAWQKGYLRKRIEFKSSLNNIQLKLINPAYTSQICSKCCAFGTRQGKGFTCKVHGTVDADINASKNILWYGYWKEISLKTPYQEVKRKLIRLAEAKSLYSVSTKTDISVGDFVRANY
jgi:IS605 OrfB family transposase